MHAIPTIRAACLAVVLAGVAVSAGEFEALGGTPGTGRGAATRSVVYGPRGMVACAQPLAAQAGLEVLKAGGSAVDAAIAMNACLGLMEPTANGIGGDLFAIVWDPKSGRLHGLNACGRSPLGLRAEQIPPEPDGTIPLYSPYAWSVPGCVDGWAELHAKFGKLPLARDLEPAIGYAERGFPLSPVIAGDWARSVPRFKDKPGFAEVFMPGGRAPTEGEIFRNPALARTLRQIADKGRDAYYRGAITREFLRYSTQVGGFFTAEDFARHRSEWVEPVSTNYRGWDVWELPPPGQGIAALQLLNLLEAFDLAAMGRGSADFWHVLTEAKKIAFADRARYYADPEFAKVPVRELISKSYARARVKALDLSKAAQVDPPGDPVALSRRETTYLCAADGDGMMVSLIQSNYTGFGSGYVIPALGFGIQDRGNLFDLKPGRPNSYAPGKRPFHTIIPGMLLGGGRLLGPFGVMGGPMQPQGHLQLVLRLVDEGLDPQAALDAPRWRVDGGLDVELEPGLWDQAERLRALGHVVRRATVQHPFGVGQAILRVGEALVGGSDGRGDGYAAGF